MKHGLLKLTIVRWQGGYGHVEGVLPDAHLTWAGDALEIYVMPGIMSDGYNVIRGEALAICRAYNRKPSHLKRVKE